MAIQRRRNSKKIVQKERFLKVIKYDPALTYLQIRERFGIGYNVFCKWKQEALENG